MLDDSGTFTGYGSRRMAARPIGSATSSNLAPSRSRSSSRATVTRCCGATHQASPIGIAKSPTIRKGCWSTEPCCSKIQPGNAPTPPEGGNASKACRSATRAAWHGKDHLRRRRHAHVERDPAVRSLAGCGPGKPEGQVTSVKSLSDVEQVLRSLRDAKDAEVVTQLASHRRAMKRLLIAVEDDKDDEDEAEEDPEELEAVKALAAAVKGLIAA